MHTFFCPQLTKHCCFLKGKQREALEACPYPKNLQSFFSLLSTSYILVKVISATTAETDCGVTF